MNCLPLFLLHPEGRNKLHSISIADAEYAETVALHHAYIRGGVSVHVTRYVGQCYARRRWRGKKQTADSGCERVIRRGAVQSKGRIRPVHHNDSAAGRVAGSLLDAAGDCRCGKQGRMEACAGCVRACDSQLRAIGLS